MKSFRIFSITALCMAFAFQSFAQNSVTETFAVSGNCGMCKTAIEKAAKEAGATDASWDKEKKELTVTYSKATTNTAKIQKQVAAAGYDNAGLLATIEAYNKLPGCCKYDRAAAAKEKKEMMDCCKDGKCTKEGHDGKDCCKKENGEKADCCKDGKCTKEGHDGKDCCKEGGEMHGEMHKEMHGQQKQ
ncbi:MAG TPA: cation transporter [Chitinophagaceae bacterium]|nr:cation transporter [Chitinophagaceae bacterium]